MKKKTCFQFVPAIELPPAQLTLVNVPSPPALSSVPARLVPAHMTYLTTKGRHMGVHVVHQV